MKMFQSKRGFTLVELIIVISVLAVLAAIAVPIAGSVLGSANTSSDDSNKALYQSAIEKFVATPRTSTPAGGGGAYPSVTVPAAGTIAANTVIAISRFTRVTVTAGLLPAPKQSTFSFKYDSVNRAILCNNAAATAAVPAISAVAP